MWIVLGIAITLLIAGLIVLWFVGSVGREARRKRAVDRAEESKPDSKAI